MLQLKLFTLLTFAATSASAATNVEFGNRQLSRFQIRQAQTILTNLGYNPGPIDGSMGNKTRAAYTNLLDDLEFEFDGTFSENDVALLNAISYNKSHPNSLTELSLPHKWSINMAAASVVSEQRKISIEMQEVDLGAEPRNCVETLGNLEESARSSVIDGSITDKNPFSDSLIGCTVSIFKHASLSGFRNGYSDLGEILKSISNQVYISYDLKYTGDSGQEAESQYYNAYLELVSNLATHYAIFYDQYNLEPDQRYIVDNFLRNALKQDIDTPPFSYIDLSKYRSCSRENIDYIGWNPRRTLNAVVGSSCNSHGWLLTQAQLAAALRFGDRELWEMAKYNTDRKLNLFDENNIDIPWAAISGSHSNYNMNVTEIIGNLTELYYSAGYDLLTFENEGGSTVADISRSYLEFQSSTDLYRNSPFFKYAERDDRNDKDLNSLNEKTLKEWFWVDQANDYTYARDLHRYIERFDTEKLDLLSYDHIEYLYSVLPQRDIGGPIPFGAWPLGKRFVLDTELLYLANSEKMQN
jgi:peptidoglycan hydrolase-like protein with peptidoglycan-binding domain